jgi:hypothetical protein
MKHLNRLRRLVHRRLTNQEHVHNIELTLTAALEETR